MRELSIDFETFYIDGDYSIRTMGADAYIRDVRFDPYLISVSDGADSWAGHPNDFNWNSLEGVRAVSHNRRFDASVYERMVVLGLAPRVNIPEWHCTANMSAYFCMRRDLLKASEFLLGVEVDKSYRLDANNRHWPDMVAAGVGEKVKSAGRADAYRCIQMWKKYNHLWPDMEKRVANLTIEQGMRGVQIDTDRLQRDLVVAQTALIQAETVLPWMKEGKKPTSTKAIAEECRKVGIPCPPVKSRDGEEAYDEWARTYGPKYKWVKAYSSYRVINKYITTLETIKSRIFDGVMPFDLYYFGAHTGRWAGAGGYNMQNMRSEPLYIDVEGWLIVEPDRLNEIAKEIAYERPVPSYVAHALDIRALKIARPGRNMIVSDLSQIEPRCLAWVTGNQPLLDRMAGGASPYQAHAETSMGWTGGDLKKEDKAKYALGKARVLSLGYQAGWKKFIKMAWDYCQLNITLDDPEFVQDTDPKTGELLWEKDGQPKMVSGYGFHSRRIVNEFRAQNPLITGLWKKLDEAFRNSVGGDFTMTLPSGRQLRYPAVMRERKAVSDPDDPKKFSHRWVTTALAWDEKSFSIRRLPFYGGKLTENLIQAIARDIFAFHLLALKDTKIIDPLWSVHDEAVNECDQGVTPKDVEHIMGKTPDWIEGLPVAAEAKLVPHYCK